MTKKLYLHIVSTTSILLISMPVFAQASGAPQPGGLSQPAAETQNIETRITEPPFAVETPQSEKPIDPSEESQPVESVLPANIEQSAPATPPQPERQPGDTSRPVETPQEVVAPPRPVDPQALALWREIQKHGAEAFRLCEYGNAERLLTDAVKLSRQFEQPEIEFADSSGDLGRLLTVRGRFKEAEPYLEEEVYLKELALGTGSGDLIQPMGSLITFYLNHGTKSKANPMTERVIDYVQGKFREQASQPTGAIKLKKGQPLTAWAGTAQAVMRDPLLEWAITCDALGDLHRAHRNYDLADRLYKVALDVKGTVLGKKHLSLANSYDSLGTLCMERGELEEAESYYRDALRITGRILEPGDPKMYSRIDKLARCLIKEKKFGEAEELYVTAKNTWGGANSKSIYAQWSLFALGCMHADRKNYATAASELRQALHIAEEINGVYSIQLVPYLRKYAYVLYYLGRRGEEQNLKARAHNIAPVM